MLNQILNFKCIFPEIGENQQFPILYVGYLNKDLSYLDEIFRIDSKYQALGDELKELNSDE